MEATPKSDRRGSSRQYLMRPVYADLLLGRQQTPGDTVRIGDISAHGIGVHPSRPLSIKPHTPITLTATIDETPVSVSGEVASSNYGHIGIRVADSQQAALQSILDAYRDRTVVSPPVDGLSRVKGTISMFARFPIQWAIARGARRLDLSEVGQMDSSGIGLLLMLGERHGIRAENCSARVCRLVNLYSDPSVCGACQQA